jgi:hypothetical protein
MRTALCWVVTQRVVVITYRRFETTYRFHLQGSTTQKDFESIFRVQQFKSISVQSSGFKNSKGFRVHFQGSTTQKDFSPICRVQQSKRISGPSSGSNNPKGFRSHLQGSTIQKRYRPKPQGSTIQKNFVSIFKIQQSKRFSVPFSGFKNPKLFGFLKPEDGTDRLSRNDDKILPLLAV